MFLAELIASQCRAIALPTTSANSSWAAVRVISLGLPGGAATDPLGVDSDRMILLSWSRIQNEARTSLARPMSTANARPSSRYDAVPLKIKVMSDLLRCQLGRWIRILIHGEGACQCYACDGAARTLRELPNTDSPSASTRLSHDRRNGYSSTTVCGTSAELRLDIPRDRTGTFEPMPISKHQRDSRLRRKDSSALRQAGLWSAG